MNECITSNKDLRNHTKVIKLPVPVNRQPDFRRWDSKTYLYVHKKYFCPIIFYEKCVSHNLQKQFAKVGLSQESEAIWKPRLHYHQVLILSPNKVRYSKIISNAIHFQMMMVSSTRNSFKQAKGINKPGAPGTGFSTAPVLLEAGRKLSTGFPPEALV